MGIVMINVDCTNVKYETDCVNCIFYDDCTDKYDKPHNPNYALLSVLIICLFGLIINNVVKIIGHLS